VVTDLPEVTPAWVRLPRLTITPFVFAVGGAAEALVASAEVDAVVWVELDRLLHPGTHGSIDIALPGGPRTFPCYKVGDEVVWGLTYRILSDFLERFREQRGG